MCERYVCNLSPKLLKKAVDELNEPEDNDERLAAIDKLRDRFQDEDNGLELIRSDDAFLLRFLRVRKFNQDRAYKTLVNYHRGKKEWREVSDLVDNPKLIKTFISAGTVVPLKNFRAKDGTYVVVARPGRAVQDKDFVVNFIAIIAITAEIMLEEEDVQIYGISVIEDFKDFTLTMAIQFALASRNFFFMMQEAMPVRMKSFHFYNQSLVFDAMYAIASPFMNDKIKNRIKLHGADFQTIHEVVDSAFLPPFLGGSGPELDDGWWAREIFSIEGAGEDTAF